jgi:hypothetical protein
MHGRYKTSKTFSLLQPPKRHVRNAFPVEEIPTEQTQIHLRVNVFFIPNLSDIRRFRKPYLKPLSVTTSIKLMHRDNTTPTHKNAIWRPIPTT